MFVVTRYALIFFAIFVSGLAAANPFDQESHEIWVGDYNGDGATDLLVRGKKEQLEIPYAIQLELSLGRKSYLLLNDGSGRYSLVTEINWALVESGSFQLSPYQFIIGDFNGDGIPDVLLRSLTEGGDSLILLLDENGNITALGNDGHALSDVPSEPDTNVTVIDLNGDNKSEIVVAGPERSQKTLTANDSGRFVPHSSGANVANTSGAASVTPSGAASYEIPIWLPNGIGGLTPNISLTYSSNGGDGVLGVGWQMSGLSSLHRCSSSLATDGRVYSPDITDEPICLNGSYLVRVGLGSEYRTEVDQFERVVPTGSSANNPVSFKVWSKSGHILDFGGTIDSRVEAVGTSKINIWALNKVADRFGNTYSISYIENNSGEFLPKEITYSPSVKVEFIYGERTTGGKNTEILFGYKKGTPYRLNKKLDKLIVSLAEVPVREYNFSYELSPSTNRLILRQVTDCAYGPGGVTRSCARPLVFGWQNGQVGFESSPASLGVATNAIGKHSPLIFDADGDGFKDLVFAKDGAWHIAPGSANGYGAPSRTDIVDGATVKRWEGKDVDLVSMAQPIRIEDKAKWGLLVPVTAVGSTQVRNGQVVEIPQIFWTLVTFERRGSAFKGQTYIALSPSIGQRPVIGDFNGDGRDDIMAFIESGFISGIREGLRSLCINDAVYSTYLVLRTDTPWSSARFDDEAWKKTQYVQSKCSGSGYSPRPENTYLFDSSFISGVYNGELASSSPINFAGARIADFNGDGLQDILANSTGSDRNVQYLVSLRQAKAETAADGQLKYYENAKNFGAYKETVSLPRGDVTNTKYESSAVVADVNGDGLPDYVYHVRGSWKVRLNKGGSFDTEISTGVTNDGPKEHSLAVDYNADGKADLLVVHQGRWHALVSSSTVNQNITFTRIDTGIAAKGFEYRDPVNLESLSVKPDPIRPTVVDVNDDGLQDIVYLDGTQWKVLYHKNGKPDLLTSVSDGYGVTNRFHYLALTQKDALGNQIYESGTAARFPYLDIRASNYVVHRFDTTNGIGGFNTTSFTYKGARIHVRGRGFQGFKEVASTDLATGITKRTIYNQDFPYTGTIAESETRLSNSTLLTSTKNKWATKTLNEGKTLLPYPEWSLTKTYELTGGLVSATKASRSLDEFGNVISETQTTGRVVAGDDVIAPFDLQVRTVTEYDNEVVNWLLGFATRSTSTSTNNAGSKSVSSTATRWRVTLMPYTQTQFANTDRWLTKTYAYDAKGNITSVDVSGADIATRTEVRSSNFLDFMYPQTISNALNQQINLRYDTRFGLPVAQTDHNNLTTYTQYDPWGHAIYRQDPDGAVNQRLMSFCDKSCPLGAVYKVTTVVSHTSASLFGAPPTIVFYDRLGREVRTQTLSFDGKRINTDTIYDQLGRVERRSQPYFEGETQRWNRFEYDVLGRVKLEIRPDGHRVAYSYLTDSAYASKVVKTHTLVNGDVSTQTIVSYKDSAGQLMKVEDAAGTPTTYTYDALGNLLTTTVNGDSKTTISITYDAAGNKDSMSDPDAGFIDYTFDALGQLKWQRDTKGQETSMEYDLLGRLVTRITPEGTTSWIYDKAAKGIGKLAAVTSPGFEEVYEYDALSRLRLTKTKLQGTRDYSFQFSYDAFSRPLKTTYPSGFSVLNHYSRFGYLKQIQDGESSDSYWSLLETNAWGQTTQESFGNGMIGQKVYDPITGRLTAIKTGLSGNTNNIQNLAYVFDSMGNLQYRRKDGAVSESFSYDQLNRLTVASTTGLSGGTRTIDYRYDALGNILTKSDVSDTDGYKYTSSRPHAVTEVRHNGSVTKYEYDANGNVEKSGNRTLVYASFNKPTEITEGNKKAIFQYDANHSYFYQEKYEHGVLKQKTYYIGGGQFEEVIDLASKTRKLKSYVGGLFVQAYTYKNGAPKATFGLSYLHKDHLGSTDAITNEAGMVLARMAFGPYGERRKEDWSSVDAPYTASLTALTFDTTSQGFTGHEQLDDFELVHMGGRVYDANIGRFISADLLVQAPNFSQSYNRYSYGWNNPLAGVDPTGYSWVGLPELSNKDLSGYGVFNDWITFHNYESSLDLASWNSNRQTSSFNNKVGSLNYGGGSSGKSTYFAPVVDKGDHSPHFAAIERDGTAGASYLYAYAFGSAVHNDLVGPYIEAKDRGFQYDNTISSILDKPAVFSGARSRPDWINHMDLSVLELKPWTYKYDINPVRYAEADAQVERYVSLLRKHDVGMDWHRANSFDVLESETEVIPKPLEFRGKLYEVTLSWDNYNSDSGIIFYKARVIGRLDEQSVAESVIRHIEYNIINNPFIESMKNIPVMGGRGSRSRSAPGF